MSSFHPLEFRETQLQEGENVKKITRRLEG